MSLLGQDLGSTGNMPGSLAGRLYGGNIDPIAPTVAEPEKPSLVDRMFGAQPARAPSGDVPQAIVEMRAADPARQMFSPQTTFASVLPDAALPGIDHAEFREVLADHGASPEQAASMRVLAHASLVETPSDEMHAGWMAQTNAAGHAASDIDAARAQVARDPRVSAFLDRTRLGSHPDVVAHFVDAARREKLR